MNHKDDVAPPVRQLEAIAVGGFLSNASLSSFYAVK
jgi:hypothetical protein